MRKNGGSSYDTRIPGKTTIFLARCVSVFGRVQRPVTDAAVGLRCRGLASQPRHHLIRLTQRVAYAPACGGESCSDAPAYADSMTLTAALAIAGGATLGLAQCQVKHCYRVAPAEAVNTAADETGAAVA